MVYTSAMTTTTEHTLTIPATDPYGHVSGETLGKLFMRQVNGMSDEDMTAFIGEVIGDHRTLQQKATGVFLNAILAFAAKAEDGNFDGRDEFSKQVCLTIKKALAEAEANNRPAFRLGDRMPLI